MGRATLNKIKVSEDIFNAILDHLPTLVKVEKNLNPYIHGYSNKKIIYYDGKENLIIQKFLLRNILNENFNDGWKQVWITLDTNLSEKQTKKDMYGPTAYNYIMKIVKNYYNEDEINELLAKNSIEGRYNIQKHHNYASTPGFKLDTIYQFKNCYYYDINGAHADALSEIFPRCKEEFNKMHDERKIKPENKDILNYSVGMLVKKGHRSTYQWIVNRTSISLNKAIFETTGLSSDSKLIYANTDGFIVKDPVKELETNKELGKFKLEAKGDVYYYKTKGINESSSYFIYQYYNNNGEKVIKGNLPVELKKYVDLSKGIVVHFDRIYTGHTYKIDNVKVVNVNESNKKVL